MNGRRIVALPMPKMAEDDVQCEVQYLVDNGGVRIYGRQDGRYELVLNGWLTGYYLLAHDALERATQWAQWMQDEDTKAKELTNGTR